MAATPHGESTADGPGHRYACCLRAGRTALGMFCCLDGAAPAHILASAGLDFIVLDRQHASYTWPDLEHLAYRLRATGAAVFIRTMGVSDEEVNLALDLPIDGIMFPNVGSAAEADAALRLCRFPPAGRRSVGNARTAAILGSDYRELPDPLAGLLIEDIGAVNEIDEIMQLTGLDFVFVGPHDLAGTMGLDVQTEKDPPMELLKAVESVRQAAIRYGVPFWSWGDDRATVRKHLERSPEAVMWSLDANVLRDAAIDYLAEMRPLTDRED